MISSFGFVETHYTLVWACRYFPFGVDGMLAGSATVFFAYIGFDSVASTAEEVIYPPSCLPILAVSFSYVKLTVHLQHYYMRSSLSHYESNFPSTKAHSFLSTNHIWGWFLIFTTTTLAGQEPPTRFTSGNQSYPLNLLCPLHACLSCHRWSGSLLCNGPWYPHFICIFRLRNALGSVCAVKTQQILSNGIFFWSNVSLAWLKFQVHNYGWSRYCPLLDFNGCNTPSGEQMQKNIGRFSKRNKLNSNVIVNNFFLASNSDGNG